MGLLILFFVISIVFSFLCSIWEAVLLSIPPPQVEIELEKGTITGKRLKHFKKNIDRPLAAILTLNTIAHTAGAIGVGAQAAGIWKETYFLGVNVAAVIVPTVMTLAILILSELIPKTLGANLWKPLMPFTVNALHYLILALLPLVWLSQLITKALKKEKDKSVLSRADFRAMTQIGVRQGIFKQDESKIIHNLLRFHTIQAKDIMTPRTVVIASEENTSIQEFFDENPKLRFSRIPVYQKTKDDINGFVLKDDLLSSIINGTGNQPLKNIRREIMIVNEQLALPDLFTRLMEKREHIALVVDEFGGMSGIVSMEDVIETLLGMEIIDELDNIADMQLLARRNWEKRAKGLGLISEEEEDIE
jgi:CBS domain containing-hemolysin-like protein